ncbi:Hypothetical protein R9X50_00703100 [Acrodontium crateriforme]|uniref:Quinone oxidoreductase n=1 Tax=Acrodontium crateriforme TaxID=150365 RepID=A0AAQ3MAQ2_9PEZI|nr:Hypothetical protein R9X50_00703100 [Acrodontium crateriforme]
MHQAVVSEWGQTPRYTEVPDLAAPTPQEVRIKVIAAGVHRVVRSRAAGKHYSSGSLPHVPGVDGIGMTEDGEMVYFVSFAAGSLSEYVNLPKHAIKPLPAGTDPIQAAGMTNPALSSWMAFHSRTTNLPVDFTVLIVGATSASGRVACSIARSLGAKRVIGVARNKAALETIGLDETIVIADQIDHTDFSSVGDVDIILDYVYGPVTAHLFQSLASKRPVQYVHIGSLSGQDIMVPGSILRSKNLTIRGSGSGAWSMQDASKNVEGLLKAVQAIPEQPIRVAKLEDVEQVWNEAMTDRLVFTM